VDLLSILFDNMLAEIDANITEFADRHAGRSGPETPPQMGPDAGQQFGGTKRLDQVIIGAGIERRHLVGFGGAR
jgi:hypothetical protein